MDQENKIKNQDSRPKGFMGPGRFGGAVDKPKDFKGSLKKLMKYVRKYWISMILMLAFASLSTVFMVYSPKVLGKITDRIVEDYIKIRVYEEITNKLPKGYELKENTKVEDIIQFFPKDIVEKIPEDQIKNAKDLDLSKKPAMSYDYILDIVYKLLALYVLSMIFSYIQGWIMTNVSQKVTYNLRDELSKKINTLPLKYYDKNTHGDILSRITNDVDTVGMTLNQGLSQIVTATTSIIGIIIMMLTIDTRMTLVSLLIIPFSMIFVTLIVKKSQPLFIKQQGTLGEINGHIEEMFSGHIVVKAFNGEKQSIEKFKNINKDLYNTSWKSQFLSGLIMPIVRFIGNIGYVVICVIGGKFVIDGIITVGSIQAFIQYFNQFNRPIAETASIANIMQSTIAAAERIFEFLEEANEPVDEKNFVKMNQIRGDVKFNNVNFSYEKDTPVIKNFTTDIKSGSRVAIVGPTGAGKTTLVNLLMRFYDLDSGSIEIDGVDIKDIRRSELRRIFGMVLQDTWLFNGTIKENLLYGCSEVSDKKLIETAKMAQIDTIINSLPKGYDMEINEDTDNISQGEKQLFTIARAMLVNPSILILDEATSSVDTRTELAIQKAMEKLMEGRTSFIIAHRLSTIRDADLILVVNEGNIVEQGNHEELLSKNGFYFELYNSQFNGGGLIKK